MKFEILEQLNKFEDIMFYDEGHRYIFTQSKNNKKPVSATTFIKKFVHEFDTDFYAEKVAKKRNTTKEKIIAEWDEAREKGSTRGTLLHTYAEDFMNNKVFQNESHPDLKKQVSDFKKYVNNKNLIPVKSEWVIGDKKLNITGTIDQVFYNPKTNKFHLFDWKTNKKIEKSNKYNQYYLPPVEHLEDCEFNTYSLQLSLYKYIILKNTKLKLGNSYIVWFNKKNDSYKIFKCANYLNEIKEMLKYFNNSKLQY